MNTHDSSLGNPPKDLLEINGVVRIARMRAACDVNVFVSMSADKSTDIRVLLKSKPTLSPEEWEVLKMTVDEAIIDARQTAKRITIADV